MEAKLTVKTRTEKGSSEARRMRNAGWIPGVIYSDGGEARSISLPKHEFQMMLAHHAGDQMMVAIQIDGEKEESVLLKDVQADALTGDVIHVDLQAVAMNKKLQVTVAVELVGDSEGVSVGGVLDQLLHELDVACLPADIPESIEVDISHMAIGDMLTINDIKMDASKYELLMDGDVGVVTVAAPRVAAEGAEDEEGAEPDVIAEKKAEA